MGRGRVSLHAKLVILLLTTLVGCGPGTRLPVGSPTEVTIGVVYPLSGRLESWGRQALPFIRMAEAEINALPEAEAAGVRFRVAVRSDDTSAEGARNAVRDLVENENARLIVGLPLSQALEEVADYVTRHRVAVISSASTGPAPAISRPDTIYRISPPELYLARTLARFALHLGYRKTAIIHRTCEWGKAYATAVAGAITAGGGRVVLVPFVETHPRVGDYAGEVAELARRVAELGADDATVVLLVAWEGEDLNILHHAAEYPALSGVRWLAAVLYPSLLDGCYPTACFPGVTEFALARALWGQEGRPPSTDVLSRLWTRAAAELGQEPRFEHVYLYEAIHLAARAALLAGNHDGETLAAAIPAAAEAYETVTGVIRLDQNGDRASADLAYYGLYRGEGGLEYRHYAYYDASTDRFYILPEPAPRPVRFSPEQ